MSPWPWFRYIYDLCIPPGSGVKPEPLDGEVESFEVGSVRPSVSVYRTDGYQAPSALESDRAHPNGGIQVQLCAGYVFFAQKCTVSGDSTAATPIPNGSATTQSGGHVMHISRPPSQVALPVANAALSFWKRCCVLLYLPHNTAATDVLIPSRSAHRLHGEEGDHHGRQRAGLSGNRHPPPRAV